MTSSSLPNSFRRMASLRAPKRWETEGASSGVYGGWGRKVSQGSVISSSVFKLVCGCALSRWRISAAFLWVPILLTCFCNYLRGLVQRPELMVWPRGIMDKKNHPTASLLTIRFTKLLPSSSQREFCGSRLGLVEPNEHTLLNIPTHQYLCSHFLDAESSVARCQVVIRR